MSHKRGTSFFMSRAQRYLQVKNELPATVTLVAVSKTHPSECVKEVYDAGCRDFGENKVQELAQKYVELPKDIRWHLIGHLQTNKVKQVVPIVHLIHSVDSIKLLSEINKEAAKINKTIDCLLQFHIATEETKFGFSIDEISSPEVIQSITQFKNVRLRGVMGMASFSDDKKLVREEFAVLKNHHTVLKQSYFTNNSEFNIISMGMSGDYEIAIEEGSTMVRVGTTIFGQREYLKNMG